MGTFVFGKEVISPGSIPQKDFDIILIASNRYYDEIKEELEVQYHIIPSQIQRFDDFILDCIIKGDIVPTSVAIEASTLCQLNCRSCYMRKNNYGVVGAGYLTFENFRRFLKNNAAVKHIELSNSGEIFMNPELKKILEYAFIYKVRLTANNGVNFNDCPEDLLEELVLCEFDALTIALDGTDQETYSWYRQKGSFEK